MTERYKVTDDVIDSSLFEATEVDTADPMPVLPGIRPSAHASSGTLPR
jgi:hypothetical protein